ncbi:MAG: aminotransferase class I/II-fold pyridoxal phosphate-dependent enzyme, partial [Candidatus Competibacterales bacterium]|nr:aminotransferase class I/II-fold pyridoxal phosphate-dependent enzyme [Candidatus Competibacterales bacterium]
DRWLDDFPNLVVTRTFSKAYGLAGLRVGYALSHPDVANLLNRVRQAFNVNTMALAAATAALKDFEFINNSRLLNEQGLEQLYAGLDTLGLEYVRSRGNFVLADVGRPGGEVYEALLRRGIIVRPVGGYGLPNHLRITVGKTAQNDLLLDALEQAIS